MKRAGVYALVLALVVLLSLLWGYTLGVGKAQAGCDKSNAFVSMDNQLYECHRHSM